MKKWETPSVTVLSTIEIEHQLSGTGRDNLFVSQEAQDHVNEVTTFNFGS